MFILLLTKAENTAKPTYSQHFLSTEVVQMYNMKSYGFKFHFNLSLITGSSKGLQIS